MRPIATPAAMLTRMNRSRLAFSAGPISPKRSSSIWGFTPRKI
jgi:hypothetical protein